MSAGVEFKATFDVTAESEPHVTRFAIRHLRARGYNVVAPNEKWETPTEFAARLGIWRHRIHEYAQRFELRGGVVRLERSRSIPGGRINAIQSNKAFDDFCRTTSRGPRKRTTKKQ